MIGFGTAICGSTAIAATSPFVKKVEDMGTSIAIVVNLLGIIGIFLLPTLSSFLIFEPFQSGLWVRLNITSSGSCGCIGEMIGLQGGEFAIAVKMGRVFCLLPLVLWLGFFSNGSQSSGSHEQSILQNPESLVSVGFYILHIRQSLSCSRTSFLHQKHIIGNTRDSYGRHWSFDRYKKYMDTIEISYFLCRNIVVVSNPFILWCICLFSHVKCHARIF